MKKNNLKSGKPENTGSKELKNFITEFLNGAERIYLPSVSIDSVVFSFHENKLKVLLIHYKGLPYYNLPGGYVEKKESLDEAALRILKERTGLRNIYLEQFFTSGSVERTQGHTIRELMAKIDDNLPACDWFKQRFVTVCYYALIDEKKVTIKIEDHISEYKWFEVSRLPRLFLDHKTIVEKGLDRLRLDLDQRLIGFKLMNESFTMGDLQKLYEAVYQKKLDRTNFQRKMLGLNILERMEKKYTGKAHKSPFLYRFKHPELKRGRANR